MAIWNIGDLGDYMGLPVTSPAAGVDVSAMPFAAYQKIWYDNYRDQNFNVDDDPAEQAAWEALFDPGNYPLVDGDNTANDDILYGMRRS